MSKIYISGIVAQCDCYRWQPPSNNYSRSEASLSVVSGSPNFWTRWRLFSNSGDSIGAYALGDLKPQKKKLESLRPLSFPTTVIALLLGPLYKRVEKFLNFFSLTLFHSENDYFLLTIYSH